MLNWDGRIGIERGKNNRWQRDVASRIAGFALLSPSASGEALNEDLSEPDGR